MLALVLRSAHNVYERQGLIAGISNAAYDLTIGPLTSGLSIAEKGLSAAIGGLSGISDFSLRTSLEGAIEDLGARLTEYEYASFPLSEGDASVSDEGAS